MPRYICFDLDGTLLDLDLPRFIQSYSKLLAKRFVQWVPPHRFAQQLLASTDAMVACKDPSKTTLQAFVDDFFPKLGLTSEQLAIFDAFYAREFHLLQPHSQVFPEARPLLESAVRRGYKLVLATNPVFPESAVRERMRWAGIESFPWELITHCENMHWAKPHPEYYQEILEHIGAEGPACLMVGNDPVRDLPASLVGMGTFLVRRPGQVGDSLEYWPTQTEAGETSGLVPDMVGTLTDLRHLLESGGLERVQGGKS